MILGTPPRANPGVVVHGLALRESPDNLPRSLLQFGHDLLSFGRIGELGLLRQLDVVRDLGDGAAQHLVEPRVGHQSLVLGRLQGGAGARGEAGGNAGPRVNAGAQAEGDEARAMPPMTRNTIAMRSDFITDPSAR